MKRNINLIELSRDHHYGLLLGWKIKEGFKRDVAVDELLKYLDHFSKNALFPHFEEEESQLLPFLSKDDSYRIRLLDEHLQIKSLIKHIVKTKIADEAILLNIADEIEKHIRFEEREMFPYIESTLSEKQLEELGKKISYIHKPYIENYPNEFWARN